MEKMLEFQVGLIEFYTQVLMRKMLNKLIMTVRLICLDQTIDPYMHSFYAKINL